MPVLLGDKRFDLGLSVTHQLEGDRLDTSRAETAAHFVPEQGTELVADKAVQHPAGLLSVDHPLVDLA